MKAPAFDYVRAKSLAEALALLRRHGEEAKVIAGGQSLVPALNLRLLSPRLLVDIGGLAELKGVATDGARLRIGALTRHAELMASPLVAEGAPLIARAMRHVAHPAVRNRGTIGGSLANADPATELPACALALGAQMIAAGADGERRIAAQEFFTGLYETALAADEILVAVEIPAIRPDERCAFLELARRRGDYAIVGLAAQGAVRAGALSDLRLAWFGVGAKPTLARAAAACLVGQAPTEAALAEAESAFAQDLEPQDDIQATAATRLHLAGVLLRRALGELLPEACPEAAKRKSA